MERYNEAKRRLENEKWVAGDKKRARLAELDAQIEPLSRRHDLQRRRQLERQREEEAVALDEVESGKALSAFEDKARPYLAALQFCRDERAPTTKAQSESASLLEEYVVGVEGALPRYQVLPQETCRRCKEPTQLYQAFSVMVCPGCGTSEPFVDAFASTSGGGEDHDQNSFSHKRMHHFSEWLASIQAKESLEVPQAVLDQVMQRLSDERVQPEDVTVHRVRDILKKLKLRRYYEHVQLITCRITGRLPPRMTPEMEEKIKVCFLAASSAFQRHCPPDRKNMISYQLVLLKLCELLGYRDFVPYFMLLKGRDKMTRMEGIWKKICEDLDWTFVASA